MKKVISVIAFVIILWSNSSSQQNNWINYTYSYGLWDFEETGNFYWLATLGGLVRVNKSDNTVDVLNRANSILSSNSVGSLCTDSEGNLWIGSVSNTTQMGGLIKHDGQNWEVIELDENFWSTYITGLNADKDDNLWFGCGFDIVKYDGDNFEYKQIIPDYMSNMLDLKNIFFDSDYNVWFNDWYGIIRIMKNGNIDSLKGMISTPCFGQDTVGNFWILDNNKMKCFSGEDNIDKFVDGDYINVIDNITFNDLIVPQYGDTINSFYIDKQNVFYLTFQSKIGIIINGYWQYLTNENSQLPDGSVYNLFVDSAENLWANMWIPDKRFRIHRYSSSIWEDVTQEYSNSGLQNNWIVHSAKDSKSEMWMVCFSRENVLTNFNGITWTNYYSTNTAALDSCFTVKYLSESLIIWSDSAIIISYDISKNEWTVFDNTETQSDEMKIDQLGNIWWGTNNGLLKYNGNEWETFLEGNSIRQLCFDQNHILYVSTLPGINETGKILKRSENSWETFTTCSGNGKWAASMVFDNENNLWFGVLSRSTVGHEYGDGLYKYNGQSFSHYDIYNSDIPGNSIVKVTTDIDDNIWVGTYGDGLSIFKENEWTNYYVTNSPLSGKSVENIISDKNGNIWASCQSYGITVIPYSEFSGTGVESLTINYPNDDIIIYPNPALENLNISFELNQPGLVYINVYNIFGEKVLSLTPGFYTNGKYIMDLNLSEDLAKGVYFCEINVDNEKTIKKLIKK
ncbi:two-component regulator propeller domain-containing protein [Bacteroidota bacterium]